MSDRQLIPVTNYFQNEAHNVGCPELSGPILSLDLGTRRVGVAVTDPNVIAITRLDSIIRSSWKRLLLVVRDLVRRFDAKTMVIGFPLNLDGSEGDAARAARDLASKFARSLDIPIYLQDERLSSHEAEERLRSAGYRANDRAAFIDSESAAVILRDFLVSGQQKTLIKRP